MGPRWIARSRATLEAPVEPPKKSARIIVRTYYTAESGELLCTDSAPLTCQAADKLEWDMQRARCRTDRFPLECITDRPRHGARLVVFPSHRPIETETAADLAAA